MIKELLLMFPVIVVILNGYKFATFQHHAKDLTLLKNVNCLRVTSLCKARGTTS